VSDDIVHGHGVRGKNSDRVGNCQFEWQGIKCDLVKVFLAKGRVVTCDPHEVVLDDQLGEEHVGLCILYCPVIMSKVMTIWKWLLVQIILDGYPFIKHLISFNETHIPYVHDVGVVGVKKKKYSFHKRKRNIADFEGSIFKIEKMLSKESVRNVGAAESCAMNCCQHFPCENTLLLRQKFWSLSFEDYKTYGLDIPRKLHTRGVGSGRKFITIQGLDIYETTWYQIIGLSRSTYMLNKSDNKRGCWFLPHGNKGTHKLCMST
jgi:hypothetical protein